MAGKILREVQSSITAKIILAAGLLLILPVCAVSGFAWHLLYSEMYKNEMSVYDTAVRQTANSIDRIFDDVLSASNMMITDDIIRAKMIDVTSTATFSDHTDVEHQFFTIQTSTLDHYTNCILIVTDRHHNCYSNESDEAVNTATTEKLLAHQPSPSTASAGMGTGISPLTTISAKKWGRIRSNLVKSTSIRRPGLSFRAWRGIARRNALRRWTHFSKAPMAR